MNQLYNTIGISKQAVNQYAKRQLIFDEKVRNLLVEAELLRREHPGCGVEKMYSCTSLIYVDHFKSIYMRSNLIKTSQL